MIVKRELPKNIDETDMHLFAQELVKEVHLPNIKTTRLIYVDLYWHSVFLGILSLKRSKLLYSPMKVRKLLSPKINYCLQTAIVFDKWSGNYFHWMTEVLPRLLFLEAKKLNIKVFIPDFIFQLPFVQSTISFFQYINFAELTVNDKTKFLIQKAFVCDLQMESGNYHPEVIHKASSFIISVCKASKSLNKDPHKRVFIYRNNLDGRGIMNFKEIESLLKKYNISAVDFGKLSLHEQVKLMQECEFLMGVHGAGLTNMMFLPTNSKILELRRFDDDHNNCYFSLASVCGHAYYYQLCKVDDDNLQTQQNRFIVDYTKLSQLLNSIFS